MIETKTNEWSYRLCIPTATGNISYLGLKYVKEIKNYYKRLIEIAIEEGDKVKKAIGYAKFGAACSNIGDFRKAIIYYNISLKIFKKIGDKPNESMCYTNIGVAYYYLGDFKKAIEFNENSLKIAKEIGDKAGESNCYENLGIIYNKLNEGLYEKLFNQSIKL